MSNDVDLYRQRHATHLQRVAQGLEEFGRSCVADIQNVDRVSARAKDPDRFAQKASRTTVDGASRYPHPLADIQDQIGLRIVVFYEATVGIVWEAMERYVRSIELQELVPESDWEFGYFGRHGIMVLPTDVVPDNVNLAEVPRFFELQIKTLFQHAWSEANHDLGYKSPVDLSHDQQRRLAFAAAQAWGADRAFEELRAELLDA
jgi:putative GTP pyrophosphokinase